MSKIKFEDLLGTGAHFGHVTRKWDPNFKPYVLMEKNGIHIINLDETLRCLDVAASFIEAKSKKGGEFLFVGTKKQASEVVASEAARCGAAYVNQRWLGGMLTNWTTMKARIDRLKDLERMESSGAIAMRPKKEGAVLRRELERLQKYLGGLKNMRRLPDVVVLVCLLYTSPSPRDRG